MRLAMLEFLRAETDKFEQVACSRPRHSASARAGSEGGRVDVTTQYLSRMERRIDRFEEMITAIEAKL